MAYITLDKNNFFNNLDIVTRKTKDKNKIGIVLKDNAYGHGLKEMAELAKEYGLTKAIVSSCEEAIKIEQYFEYILVLSDTPKNKNSKIRYTINTLDSINLFEKGTKVELKIDSGMHRNGISEDEIELAFIKLKERNLILESIFTHHRGADALNSEWFWQNQNFKAIKIKTQELSKKYGFKNLKYHSSNSASLLRQNDFNEDMARVGMAIYGCLQISKELNTDSLKPVLSLYAKKISSRTITSGQGVGYLAKFTSDKVQVVSNYDFGYGDGFLRICSNTYKTPQNYKQIGIISMDSSSFICEDDNLLIFNDAREMAKTAQTIAYEVLTSLKENIPRKIISK